VSATRRRATWGAMLVVLAVALAVGGREPSGPRSVEEQVHAVASRVRCPTCRGLSAAVSDAPAAEAIRDEVGRRLGEGQSEEEIVDYLVASYGTDIVLAPDPVGAGLLVWVLPVVVGTSVVAGIGIVLARRRGRRVRPTEEDRDLVARARAGGESG